MRRDLRFIGSNVAVAGLLAAFLGGTALAKQPPVTKVRFKLENHQVALGEEVHGSVLVLSGKGKDRAPLEGAVLSVLVNKVEVGTVTTDAAGLAEVAYTAPAEGGYVMKLFYAGDESHKRAKRAQGFEVGGEPEGLSEDLDQV